MIGKTLDHYQIVEQLGAGGMGIVYKARDLHLERFVAIKILPPEKFADPDRKSRFVQEAKAASALNHPNIVTIHDIATADGTDFIAMEYVAGRTLGRIIGRNGLRVSEALGLAVQIADALAKAHSAGIVHRDLKPANIMVNEDGVVKILDFGLAKLMEPVKRDPSGATETLDAGVKPHTEKGMILGTVAYMSPEQAQGKRVDARSDIFSFGAVLYEMLTGQPAFQGESTAMILASILQKEPRPLGEAVEDLPPEVDRLLSRCLRKDPQRRWQSMADLKIALQDLKEDSDSGRLSPAAAIPRRRISLRLILPASAVVIAMAAGLAWWLLHRPPADAELKLSRFTFDSGVTFGGAISPDGKLVTYASDRSDEGNLDIYVQQIAGRGAIRITNHPADDMAPGFSPDGSRIVFRSSRDGGGIYVIDTLGGEERKVAGGGLHPSFSPDGSLILYAAMPPSADVTLNRMYIVPSQGGDPKPFQEEFGVIPMFGMGPAAGWSPDGRFVLFCGVRGRDPRSSDWWVAPVAGGDPIRTGAVGNLASKEWSWIYPNAWSGNRVIFSAGTTTAEGASLYSVPIEPGNWKISGPARRLTSGPGLSYAFPAAVDGHMGISTVKAVGEVCSITLDPAEGTVTGAPQRLSRDETAKQYPAISRNGTRTAYVAATTSPPVRIEIRLGDAAGGRESTITARGTAIGLWPTLSADGSVLAYRDFISGKWHSFLATGRAGTAREVCEGCSIHSFFSDPKEALVRYGNEIVRQDFSTGDRAAIVQPNDGQVLDADLSPDDRWVAFVLGKRTGSNAIYLVPVKETPALEKEWIPIADEDTVLDSPRWSADGNLLYFISERDGRFCIWARRLHPETRKPAGSAFEVYHERRARYIFGPKRWRKISVARDRLVTLMCETTSNIWIARLEPE